MNRQKHSRSLRALAALLALPVASYAQTTGFLQTAAGPFDYNTAGNWVSGAINGVWDSSLTLAAAQTTTFASDTSLASGLRVGYTGGVNLTFRSDGAANRTLALGGDILINTVSANRTVTLGSTTANQGLHLDFDGATRTFDVRGSTGTNNIRTLAVANNLSDGSLVIQGGGVVSFASGSGRSTASLTDLTLKNIELKTNGTSDIALTGDLVIDGAGGVNGSGNSSGVSIISLTTSASRNNTITAANLVRENAGVAIFRGTALGTAAVGTSNASNITFSNSPSSQLIGGGGAAGSTTISILPWALGGTTATAIDSFVTYGTNGIRALTAAEFANSITDGSTSANNVKLLSGSGTTTLNSATAVNSLFLAGNDTTATILAGTGTLTVASGAVYMTANNTATAINANLDFGTAQGVVGYGFGKGTAITGAFGGSGGLVLYQGNTGSSLFSDGSGVTISGNAATSTYTGDTYVLGRAAINVNGFLPSDTRSGDLHISGVLDYSSNLDINGLNGAGRLSRSGSGAAYTLTLGHRNASGNFTGVISDNGNITLRKTGTGTQILGGANTYKGGTQVNQGTLLVTNITGSGTGTGAITVASGARFGGSGISTGLVTASAANSTIIAGGVGSLGTLTLSGGLTAASGATFEFEVNGASVDTINFGAGSVSMGGVATFNFTSLGTVQTGTAYSLFAGSGDWSSVAASFVINAPTGYVLDSSFGGGAGYFFDAGNHSLQVQFASAVPEPSTFALLGGVAALGLAATRRRRASHPV